MSKERGFIRGVIEETFGLTRSSPYFTNVWGLVAIIITIKFVASVFMQMLGLGIIPRALERVVDTMTGFLFGRGLERYNNRGHQDTNVQALK